MSALEWSRSMGPDDMTVGGLARLEAEVLRPWPEVRASIGEIVAGFASDAAEVEARHDGARLMAPVQERRTRDWRASANGGLAALSFLLVLLPACAFGISLRSSGDFESVTGTVAVLLAVAAVICVIKILSTLRDTVWAGVSPRWALAAAAVSALTAAWCFYVGSQVPRHEAGAALAVIGVSTAVVVGFAALTLARQVRASRALASDLADAQPAIDAYLAEFRPKYELALARIGDAVETIEPNTRSRLLRERNAIIASLAGNRGLYGGAVPLFMNKKALGELALFAVAEPLLGGGPHPVRGRGRPAG